jgi:hypothetical protein
VFAIGITSQHGQVAHADNSALGTVDPEHDFIPGSKVD